MQATEILKSEHDLIERVLTLLEQTVERIDAGRSPPEGFPSWSIEFFCAFADRSHHAKEEDSLFPLLEERGVRRDGGPIGVMLSEHTIGRECVRHMRESVDQSPCDCQSFAHAAREYATMLRQHIYKENNVLFRMADGCLSDEDDGKLIDAFQAVEEKNETRNLRARFETELADWERVFNELPTTSVTN